jgi:hypothetical protein
MCGARTRTGGACPNIPLKGRDRCLTHCGPKAAREYRERQRQEFLSGKLSAGEWRKAEARRAANRLHKSWEKNPWLPGGTIDLGEHEATFRTAVAQHRVALDGLPPAVADWLRWKFRRYQIDRQDGTKWADVLSIQLPERLRKVGPGPRARTNETREPISDSLLPTAFKTLPGEGAEGCRSKRRLSDGPKAPAKVRHRKQLGPGRPRKVEMDEQEHNGLALFIAEHNATLAPLFVLCTGDRDQMTVIWALRNMLAHPRDPGLREHWTGVLRKLGAV